MADDARLVDPFDYEIGQLHGLPGVTSTRQATVRHIGLTETLTWIVQTFRKREVVEEGDKPKPAQDTIFVEFIGPKKGDRFVIPAPVAEIIARQRDQLTTTSRLRGARKAAQTRRERGIPTGKPFTRTKKGGKK